MLNLAWPNWWSDEAELSPSACAELRFTLARKLGLDAKTLLTDDEPRFIWKVGTFKNLSTATSDAERETIISYATSLARALLSGVPEAPTQEITAQGLRALLLKGGPFVGLQGLLSFCWAIGVPVVQIRVFPLPTKRMSAMTVRINGRYAILLARESKFPAYISYYLGHELGHIALGHLSSSPALIDVEDPLGAPDRDDPEEVAADRFALEVLTGTPEPRVLTEADSYSAAALARAVTNAAPDLQIEPGTLALCFGYNTGRWDKVNAALGRIYPGAESVGTAINRYAMNQVRAAGEISEENEEYLGTALGAASE